MGDSTETPEPLQLRKWIWWVLHKFSQEGTVIKGAPILLAMAVLGGAACGYILATAQFGDRLATADDRLKLATEQVGAYKDKLEGANPDQAAEGLAALRAALAEERDERIKIQNMLGPRVLSNTEREAIISAERGATEKISLFASPRDGEAFFYAIDWSYALKSAGVPAQVFSTDIEKVPQGVAIYTLDRSRWGKLVELCAEAGLIITLSGAPYFPTQPADSIVVGTKPITLPQTPAYVRALEKSLTADPGSVPADGQ